MNGIPSSSRFRFGDMYELLGGVESSILFLVVRSELYSGSDKTRSLDQGLQNIQVHGDDILGH